jgi:ketosteroid isomerase-like protein
MAVSDATAVAIGCLAAWSSGDLDRARTYFADDVTFVGPLATTKGVDEYIAGLERLIELVTGADVQRTITEGDEVCVIYDLVTRIAGAVPTVGWYTIRDGKVAAVRVYFDPRPLIGG